MREEDLDWKTYHIIVTEGNCLISDLVGKSGIEKEVLLKSLVRLEKKCLIKTDLDSAYILSLQETIFKTSIVSLIPNTNSPVIIEKNIIKANPNYKGKF